MTKLRETHVYMTDAERADRLLNIDAICAELSMTPDRLELLIKEGALPRARLVDGYTVYVGTDVDNSDFVKNPEKYSPPKLNCFGPSRVYFIGIGDFIKIGYTGCIKKRLGQIRYANPFPCELIFSFPGGKDEEAFLHRKFFFLRHRGEWFRKDEVLLEFIESKRAFLA